MKKKKQKDDVEFLEEKVELFEVETKKESIFADKYLKNVIFVTLFLFAIELLFKAISALPIIEWGTLRILISDIIISLIVVFISSLTKRKWLRNTILLLFIFVYSLYSWLQLGFINFLGVYISFNTSSQFGAVTDYIFDFLMSFKLIYYVIFMPFIFAFLDYVILERKREYHKVNLNLKNLVLIPCLILLSLIYYSSLKLNFMQNEFQIKSNIELFNSPDVPTVAVNQFGTVVFGLLDFKTFLMPENSDNTIFNINNLTHHNKNTEEEEIEKREGYQHLIDVAKDETNKKYQSLNNYFASQTVTDYNEYTGMFEGKNVIVILMESVNEAIINEEYFPNFTKIYKNGWSWKNHYSPRNSCATGNNEFSAMTSLYSIYNTCTSNVYKDNTYFEAIFNLFNNKGYETTSMHDFVEWYYKRDVIHPNMGSGKFYNSKALDIKTANYYGEWPSDEEFFTKGMDIILNSDSDKPFMTWFTTVTSHQPYSSSSTYGDLYKDYFKDLGYSTTVSRYLSKLKVVDNAVGIMIDKLESANKLDDTVIVMLADHYPYGLNKSQVGEIVKHDLTDYEIEKTPFVIYNPSMSPRVFDEYTSYINMLPTLANLMNLDYDPRLYMGADLLSDSYESRVVFADGSWKNEKAYYNASTSKIKYYGEETYTAEEIQKINAEISLKISMSSTAIKNNYFKYLDSKLKEYETPDSDVAVLNDDEENTANSTKEDIDEEPLN